MSGRGESRDAPVWMSNSDVRRQITEQIKQRRAKRMRALKALEIELREPLRPALQPKE